MQRRIPMIVLTSGILLVQVIHADTIPEVIRKAGNAATDEARLGILQTLRQRSDLAPETAADADQMIAEIDRWIHSPKLDYFGPQVLKTDHYDFGIAESSPFFPIAELYRARMLTWVTLEYGGLWSNAESRRKQFDKIRPLFEQAAEAFPENPLIKMYLGTPMLSEKSYEPDPAAPEWANRQRESLERLTDIIQWWIDHRMQDDGQYGGGWGDDCEMWRWWIPVLIGFDDPKIIAAQDRFSRALLSQPHMSAGYTSHVYDVEHTSEDSSDALTPMMLQQPDDTEWQNRAMRLAELMETLWSGINERGYRQFKSIYFSATEIDLTPKRACDTVYHPRAVQPALLLWQRTGDARLKDLFASWMDGWVDATARGERGKPAGIIPSAIHWPDGAIGGVGENWWDPEGHSNDPLYVWPSAMSLMTQTLLLTHHMTGDPKYLEPLRTMAEARRRFLDNPPESAPVGSEAWCAQRLGGLSSVLGKYRLLTGDAQFDDLIRRDGDAYLRNRLGGDVASITGALDGVAKALSINFPGYTSEVRYTDRVLRFPAIFNQNGMYEDAIPGIEQPDTTILYATVTGDPGHPQVCPLNAVRWLTPPREIAAFVTDSGPDRFAAELFHFGTTPRSLSAEFYLLQPGSYTARLTFSGDDASQALAESTLTVSGPRATLAFELPSRRLCTLRIERVQ